MACDTVTLGQRLVDVHVDIDPRVVLDACRERPRRVEVHGIDHLGAGFVLARRSRTSVEDIARCSQGGAGMHEGESIGDDGIDARSIGADVAGGDVVVSSRQVAVNVIPAGEPVGQRVIGRGKGLDQQGRAIVQITDEERHVIARLVEDIARLHGVRRGRRGDVRNRPSRVVPRSPAPADESGAVHTSGAAIDRRGRGAGAVAFGELRIVPVEAHEAAPVIGHAEVIAHGELASVTSSAGSGHVVARGDPGMPGVRVGCGDGTPACFGRSVRGQQQDQREQRNGECLGGVHLAPPLADQVQISTPVGSGRRM